MKISDSERKNSFFKYGGMEILSIEQDEYSHLWKIKLATDGHYVVSKEFDRTKGLYANAPDDIVRNGLMGYSNSLIGNPMSIYDVMTSFIDRCFDDSVFSQYTSKAAWICMDFPHYEEVESILCDYDARICWENEDGSEYMRAVNTAINKYLNRSDEDVCIDTLLDEFKSRGITTVFMNDDQKCEKFIRNPKFENISVFKAQFKNDGEFCGFSLVKH